MYPPPHPTEQLQTQTSAHPVIRLPAKPNIRSTEQLHTRTSAQPHLRTPKKVLRLITRQLLKTL